MSAEPNEPTVVLLAHAADAVARCLHALAAGPDIIAGGDRRGRDAVREFGESREALIVECDGAALWNEAAARTTGDLILLDARTELTADAVAGLLAAARRAPDAATITPLSNDASFLSVPRRNLAWPLVAGGRAAADVAHDVAEASLDLLPRIPTALPHAVLVTRRALELVGPFDEGMPPREALADFCMRAQAIGLPSIAADAVYVSHRGETGGPAAHEWPGVAAENHPALAQAVRDAAWDRRSALARSLLALSVALEPLQVTIDGRGLAGSVSGTTVLLVELIGALAARDDVNLRVLMPDRVDGGAEALLDRAPGLDRLSHGAVEGAPRSHVAHRPSQIESLEDIALLDRLGERTVITHQDLIGYRTAQLFRSPDSWLDLRRTTRDGLALASMVLFSSQAALRDALADDLISPERARVVPLGAGPAPGAGATARVPDSLAAIEGSPLLVMIGRRYRHKNSSFALALFAELRGRHGWEGELVLAGSDVLDGSASADDAAWLLGHGDVAGHVHEIGAIETAEKAWLLANASAVLYPSTYEGFGLVPFEAANAGVPCAFAPVSALAELAGPDLALIDPWSVERSAERLIAVLSPGEARERHLAGLLAAAGRFSWATTAELAVAAYRDAARMGPPGAVRLTDDLAAAESAYWAVRDRLSPQLWRLVDPEVRLLDDDMARRLADRLDQGGGAALRRWLRLRGGVRRITRRSGT